MIHLQFLLLIFVVTAAYAEIFFEEKFHHDTWQNTWIYSKHSGKEYGKFVWSHGKFWHDAEEDKGIQTSQDAKFYALSNKFSPFSNKNRSFVLQFTVKHEQNIDCGGGYIKVFDCSLNQLDMHGDSPYLVMFGPDICGPSTKKVHVIINYKEKNFLIKKDIRCNDDVYTHLYTFIMESDNTYKVLIDNEIVEQGNLEDDWDFLPPKKIKDPSESKPADWDDKPTVPDPHDTKPSDWDKPEHIADPDASKPDDWDDEMDGEWEAPIIDNPEFKGTWKPKSVDNPNYKGPWIHPEVANPEYIPDETLYLKNEFCAVGFDLWQVKSGTIFDNILLTDDVLYAKQVGEDIWKTRNEGEKIKKENQENEENLERNNDLNNISKEKKDESENENTIENDQISDENRQYQNAEDHDEL